MNRVGSEIDLCPPGGRATPRGGVLPAWWVGGVHWASVPHPPARLAPESWHGTSTWSTCWQFLSPNSQASWQNFRNLQGEEVALLLVGVLETFLIATINCIAMGQKVLWWQIKTQSDYYCQRIKQTKVRRCFHSLPIEMRNSQQNALNKIVVV